MSTIFVTGGAGYIGSHVVKALLKRGHCPIVFDNLQTGHREAVKGALFIRGDLNDQAGMKEVFRSHSIESAMHFAADCLVGESVKNPLKYFNNNVKNGIQLIEIMTYFGINKIVFSSSAAVYGEPTEVPIQENHPCHPTNPYGETKWILERVLHTLDQTGKMAYVSLRYFNAAGADPSGELGEDHSEETHLIPIGLLAAMSGKPVSIFGKDYDTPDGTCIRDYIHVADLAQAHILALERLEAGGASGIYNLGNGNGYSVTDVINSIKRVTGKKVLTVDSPRRPGDPARLVASSEKIKAELGWNPEYPGLERIIETAWEWHRNHPEGYND